MYIHIKYNTHICIKVKMNEYCKLWSLISVFTAMVCRKALYLRGRPTSIIKHWVSNITAWPTFDHSSLNVWDISRTHIHYHTLRVTHPTPPYKEMRECFAWLVDAPPKCMRMDGCLHEICHTNTKLSYKPWQQI